MSEVALLLSGVRAVDQVLLGGFVVDRSGFISSSWRLLGLNPAAERRSAPLTSARTVSFRPATSCGHFLQTFASCRNTCFLLPVFAVPHRKLIHVVNVESKGVTEQIELSVFIREYLKRQNDGWDWGDRGLGERHAYKAGGREATKPVDQREADWAHPLLKAWKFNLQQLFLGAPATLRPRVALDNRQPAQAVCLVVSEQSEDN